MKEITIVFIKFYQYLTRSMLQSLHLPLFIYSGCKYYPTCSDYAIGSIHKYGFTKGSFRAGIRVLKCNPLSKGGINNP